jgi:hypothetical protein
LVGRSLEDSMKLSLENLEQGLKWWQQSRWPPDYLNQEYYKIYQDRGGGLTEEWLAVTVDRLAKWTALRSSKPGNTKAKFLVLLKASLPNLRKEYQQILDLSRDEPSTNTASWQDIDALYRMMAHIKNGSPVFGSKLGHFMFPNVFIVMDNRATGRMPYEYYWQGTVNEWRLFADKTTAINLLKTEIRRRTSQAPHEHYPYETKIMELCHVGDKWKMK